jgi:spermidine synthase
VIRAAAWLATSAAAGALTMALELTAFRLYAPYFGYSIYVWGTMISIVLAALAVGYGAGGWIADRTRSDRPIYIAILLSAFHQFVIVWTARSFLPHLALEGDFVGTGLATLLIFAPPMATLATVGPIVVRLLAREGRIGTAAGTVYAVSTAGSMAGVLATSFYLVPVLGTQNTLRSLCAASLLLAIVGLAAGQRRAAAGLLPLLPVLLISPDAIWPPDTVSVDESAYNFIRVVRRGDRLILFLNDDVAQTVMSLDGRSTGLYYDEFVLGPLLVEPHRLLVLGMGAGGSINAVREVAPEIEVDAVEIDPKVVVAAERWFGVDADDPKLRVHVADARRWLASDQGRYDLVHLDTYQGGPYIPFYLLTIEFFGLIRDHMMENGLLMVNLFDVSADRELLTATVATIERAFPSVMVVSGIRGNHMIFAFTRPTSLASVRARLGEGRSALARSAATAMVEISAPVSTRAFTDDLAPVEQITKRMLQ